MRDIAERLLDAAHAAGATYADARVVERTTQSVTVKNGQVNNVIQFEDAGSGVRVLVDGAWGFCGTQRTDADGLETAARLAVRIARASARTSVAPVRLAPVPSVTATGDGYAQTRSFPNSFGRQQLTAGWDVIEEMDLVGNGREIAEEAMALL